MAQQAIELLEQCETVRKQRIDRLAMYARANALNAATENLPRPKNFPASYDDFLRCVMPNKRPEDRAKCHREYVRQRIHPVPGQTPADDDVANCIAKDKRDGFSKGVYDFMADDFRRWLPQYEAANRSARARAGAVALKKKRQKSV